MEQARAFRALMERTGWSARQVARELAYPQSSLVKVLELLELPEPVQARVERGELPVTTAYELRTVADPAEQVAVADRAVAEGLTREQVTEIIRRRPGRPDPVVIDLGDGCTVTVRWKKAGALNAPQALRKALKTLQEQGRGEAA
jgi:ParB family transcriptional regulator, chromosome partitioning protein